MAIIEMTGISAGIVIVDTEADLTGVTIAKSQIPIYVKSTRKLKITDGTTSCDQLPYVIGEEPIGHIGTFTPETAPPGYLELDGTRLQKSLYPQIYAIFGGTYGEDNNRFRLPDTRGMFQDGSFWNPTRFDMNYWIKYE